MGDAWEDEGYQSEDDWGEESLAADVEEDLVDVDGERDLEPDLEDAPPGGDQDE